MALDQELLDNIEEPTLHLYEFEKPSATYGYFIRPFDHLTEAAKELDLAKRPTGGGIIFHTHDLTFSLLIPAAHPGFLKNTLDSYAFVNKTVAQALTKFLGKDPSLFTQKGPNAPFCMAKPTVYDVMIEGKKVGGAAQRKTKKGLLHQASIQLGMPSIEFLKKHLKNPEIISIMQEMSLSHSGDRKALQSYLIEEIKACFPS